MEHNKHDPTPDEVYDYPQQDDAETVQSIQLGVQAEQFRDSPLGQFLLGVCLEELESAHHELESIKPGDHDQLFELQVRCAVARKFPNWITTLIDRGVSAAVVLDQKHETDYG